MADTIAVFDGVTPNLLKDSTTSIGDVEAAAVATAVSTILPVDLSGANVTGALPWGSVDKTGSSLADLATRSASDLNTGTLPDSRFPTTLPAASGANLTSLNASSLSSGTVPDARFPATLPAASGANLTSLNASNLSSGTVPDGRFPGTLPASSGANLTSLNASNLSSGTVPDGRFPATLPSASAANLTSLNATNLATGTVPQARKWTEVTVSTTGNIDNLDFSNADLLRMSNSSAATIRGLAAGVAGQRVVIVSVGAAEVTLAHQNSNSTAANRLINFATSAATPLAPGTGAAIYEYDATTQRWRLVAHEQGAWLSPSFNAGDFTANGSMTWTVGSSDVQTYSYYLRGRSLLLVVHVSFTTIGGTVNTNLQIKIPGGFTSARSVYSPCLIANSSRAVGDFLVLSGGATNVLVENPGATNWSLGTDNVQVSGQISFEVQ